ncbi:MAG: hypothetical protein ACFCU1_03860 [Sumerlaeia bacterium]
MIRLKPILLFISLVFLFFGCAQDKSSLSSVQSKNLSNTRVLVCFQPSISFLARELLKGDSNHLVVLAGSTPASLQTPGAIRPSHFVLFSKESSENLFQPWQDYLKESERDVYLRESGFPLEAFFTLSSAEELIDELSQNLIAAYPTIESVVSKNNELLKKQLRETWYTKKADPFIVERLQANHIVTDRESVVPMLRDLGFSQIKYLPRAQLGKITRDTHSLLVKIDPRPFPPELAAVFAEQGIPIVAFNSDDKVFTQISDIMQERERLINLVMLAALSA